MPLFKTSGLLAALLATALFGGLAPSSFAQNAAAFVVADSASGHLFQTANPTKKLQIGSLTKIATAAVVLDWLELTKGDITQIVAVPPGALNGTQNPIGFQPGDRLSVRDLLYAALLQSDNISADTLADYVGQHLPGARGGEVAPVALFVAQMNALARRLHMDNTLFVNPHGLDSNERKLPYSTAADLAKLTIYAMAKSQFRFYVSQKERSISLQHPTGESAGYQLQNTNELLGVDAIDGVKTGTTQRAGQCLIISAARTPESKQTGENKYDITPRRLIVVVLGSADRFGLASSLLRSGWASHDQWVAAGRPAGRNER